MVFNLPNPGAPLFLNILTWDTSAVLSLVKLVVVVCPFECLKKTLRHSFWEHPGFSLWTSLRTTGLRRLFLNKLFVDLISFFFHQAEVYWFLPVQSNALFHIVFMLFVEIFDAFDDFHFFLKLAVCSSALSDGKLLYVCCPARLVFFRSRVPRKNGFLTNVNWLLMSHLMTSSTKTRMWPIFRPRSKAILIQIYSRRWKNCWLVFCCCFFFFLKTNFWVPGWGIVGV